MLCCGCGSGVGADRCRDAGLTAVAQSCDLGIRETSRRGPTNLGSNPPRGLRCGPGVGSNGQEPVSFRVIDPAEHRVLAARHIRQPVPARNAGGDLGPRPHRACHPIGRSNYSTRQVGEDRLRPERASGELSEGVPGTDGTITGRRRLTLSTVTRGDAVPSPSCRRPRTRRTICPHMKCRDQSRCAGSRRCRPGLAVARR